MLIIEVNKGNIDKALKQYKRKVIKTKQLKKLRELKNFIKPSAKNRLKHQKAKYLQTKEQS